MRKQYRALGRMKSAEMNKTEAAYAEHLEERRLVGEVIWWRFEGIKLRIADGCFYSGDFAVMLANGQMEIHEVKGKTKKTRADGSKYDAAYAQDDSIVKIKAASEMYPFVFRLMYPRTGGGWNEKEF